MLWCALPRVLAVACAAMSSSSVVGNIFMERLTDGSESSAQNAIGCRRAAQAPALSASSQRQPLRYLRHMLKARTDLTTHRNARLIQGASAADREQAAARIARSM